MTYCRDCGLWFSNGFCLHGTVAEISLDIQWRLMASMLADRINRAILGMR